eukprot:gene9159-6439_t
MGNAVWLVCASVYRYFKYFHVYTRDCTCVVLTIKNKKAKRRENRTNHKPKVFRIYIIIKYHNLG